MRLFRSPTQEMVYYKAPDLLQLGVTGGGLD